MIRLDRDNFSDQVDLTPLLRLQKIFTKYWHRLQTETPENYYTSDSNYPPSAGLFAFRQYAMMHIAMFDAINSIERKYQPYHVQVPATPAASTEAAAAQAARDVLVALIPSAQLTFNAALEQRLGAINKPQAARGAAIGKQVAQAVLDWRTDDGSEQPEPPYSPPPLPGLWQPTTPGQGAVFIRLSTTKPFGLLTATQYLPRPFPMLDSPEYAQDVDEVQQLGEVNSATRTEEQTLLARLIQGVGYGPNPFGLWNHVAREITSTQHLSLIDAARLFALLNASMNDGLQTSQTSKFVYNLWRPVTAIRRADEDMNDDTIADPQWTPLITTPAYPSHSSNIACIASSAARSIERLFNTEFVPFTMTWTGLPNSNNPEVSWSYDSVWDLAEEAALARVYGGIHFRFELAASFESCTQVADYLFENYMQPKR